VGAARVPVVLLGLVMAIVAPLSPPGITPDHPPQLTGRLIAIAVVGCVTLAWQLVLLYRGFSTASGLRGARRISAFMVGVLLAEFGSKMVLAELMRLVA
jgi:threonine/homoserine/homoserine lactone efflux protein